MNKWRINKFRKRINNLEKVFTVELGALIYNLTSKV